MPTTPLTEMPTSPMAVYGRLFRNPDYRILWFGSLFSFFGGFIQTVAQGFLVYELTGDLAKLGFVTFCSMVPVAFIGPIAGMYADKWDRKVTLATCQALLMLGPLAIAILLSQNLLRYEHVLVASLWAGTISAFEIPVRQIAISSVIEPADLPVAIPLNALTFNLARLLGPVLGGLILAYFGVAACFTFNGLSFLALFFAALAVKTDLKPAASESAPIWDLLYEGFAFTFRDGRLRNLLIFETIISFCALHYLAQMPAIAKDQLGLDGKGLGTMYSMIGIGTVIALILLTVFAMKPWRARMIRFSMLGNAIGLTLLAGTNSPWVAFPTLALLGLSTVVHFNSTNTLFQILSPDRLKGRVVSMHIWALSGIGPFGTLLFSWIAHLTSLSTSFYLAAIVILLGALAAFLDKKGLGTI